MFFRGSQYHPRPKPHQPLISPIIDTITSEKDWKLELAIPDLTDSWILVFLLASYLPGNQYPQTHYL